ncbi:MULTISPECIES: hypothetical protein [unclassified Paenibacillus]|uniref:hypothetical protein n=1 Tax=unclassified Paenibacillus TaxID=185978 RepID=UPI003635C42E
MFDTINLKTHIYIHPDYLQQAKLFTYLQEGEPRTKYTIYDPFLPLIEYTDYNQLLEIDFSIPKFLFGNNVNLLKESDIPLFLQRLQSRLHELFNIHVRNEDWYTKRLDVCWNFPVNDEIDDYLKELAAMKFPRMKLETHGICETVIHKNKSRRISFYNKYKECISNRQSQKIIDKAQGLLRMEINLKGKSLSKYSPKRKATELLTRSFFDYITQPIVKQIKLSPAIEGLTMEWIKNQPHTLSQIESVLGFHALHSWLTQSELKQIYSTTTYDRKVKLSKRLMLPSQKSLKSLTINFAELG